MAQSSRLQAETIWAALEAQAETHPDKVAYRILDVRLREQEAITYSNLRLQAEIRAALLAENGCAGEPVFFFQPTGLDFIISFFAVLRGGGTVVPLNPRITLGETEDLGSVLADAAPSVVLCDPPAADRIKRAIAGLGGAGIAVLSKIDHSAFSHAVLPAPASDCSAAAVIQYTSGSTRSPKGVCVSHANFLANARVLTQTFVAGPDDIAVSWLPLFHDMGLMTGLIWPVVAGASAVLLRPPTFAARPISWLKALSDHRGTISAGPNFAYQLCADRVSESEAAGLDLSSWRIAICGAEPINPRTVEQFLDRCTIAGFNPDGFYPSYGQAEATLFVSGGRKNQGPPRILAVDARILEQQGVARPRPDPMRSRSLVSCGRPASNLDLKIVDPQTSLSLPQRRVGEIWINGPSVSSGYLGREDVNVGVFGAVIAEDEQRRPYLRTGDLGFVDEGELFVVGRLKDLIIVRGAKYAPQDLEFTCARAHRGLENCRGVVFALESEADGCVIVLHEMSRDFADQAASVINALKSAIAQAHGVTLHAVALLPRRTLPLTSSGKVRRGPTRAAWLAGQLPTIASWRDPASTAVSIQP